ncbi:MAG: 4Fe-4S dicluster domain-containing protein [Proteocatella sp.]
MEINELKKIIKDCGVAGAGGAGFPTYMKLDRRVDTIILNCAECEPLLKVHRQLLQNYAFEIVKTLKTIAEALDAKEVIIAVKDSYKEAVSETENAIQSLGLEALMRLGILPEVYPAGDEVVTIYETTKKVVPPGSIPLEIGIAVFNVETIFNVSKAIKGGRGVYEKYLTIAGEVKSPTTRCVPIGMSVADAVTLAGGATVEEPVFINGGPMTGRIVGGNDVITKTTNAILVLPKNHTVVNKKTSNISIDMKRAMAACCQCQMCTDLCPRNMLGHPIEPHAFMRSATSGATKDMAPFTGTFFCSQCGLCEMYACDQGLAPKTLIDAYKSGIRKQGIVPPKNVILREVNQIREYRKVPMRRLTARLGLADYNLPALLCEDSFIPKMVKIPMSQHIGAPSVPNVKENDMVQAGQVVGLAKKDSLSIPSHASIDGIVVEVNERYVIIKSTGTTM